MKNTLKVLFLFTVLLFWLLLTGQELLEEIITWDAGVYTELKCENDNRGGSDLNNDGYDDYATITSGDIFVQFYLGGEELQTTFDLELLGVLNSWKPTWGGDLNGDGYKDIVWSKCDGWGQQGDIYICLGGEEIDVEPEMIFHQGDFSPDCWYISVLNSGFDFNGDGYDDLLAYGATDMAWEGLIHIFLGAEEFSTELDYYIQGEMGDELGYFFAAGDLNGDGYDDLVASRRIYEYENACLLEVYLGGTELDMVCDYVIQDTLYSASYQQLPTGDINGDGRDELILYCQESSLRTYNINSSGELVAEDYDIVMDGRRIIADINGDSISDLVCWNRLEEIVVVYYGGDSIGYGYDAYIDVTGMGSSDARWFICGLGDINGDGEDEILVNDGDGTGDLGTTATVYGLPGDENKDNEINAVEYALTNYPNPFNPVTRIEFELKENMEVELAVYDLKGQLVKRLVKGEMSAGRHIMDWDGRNGRNGQNVSSGIYLCSLRSGGRILAAKKMLLLQ